MKVLGDMEKTLLALCVTEACIIIILLLILMLH